VPSDLQVADFFTKAQTREQYWLHLLKLALDPPLSPWVWGGVLSMSRPMDLIYFKPIWPMRCSLYMVVTLKGLARLSDITG
jgi:hypothetical protein